MTTATPNIRDNLAVLIEGGLYLFLIACGALALNLHLLSLQTATSLSALLLLLHLGIAWKRFDGGRHPCFLFLGMLLIFQAGRLLGYTAGILPDPFRIELQTAVPFDVSDTSAELTLCVVLLSAVCIYLPCRWNFRSVRFDAGSEQNWLPAAYILLALTFPAVLYKNYQYFDFVRSHGGYLAIYTDSDEVLHTVGFATRLLSLLAYNTFLLIFVMERRRAQLTAVTCLFFSASLIELMIGFRGKVFLLLVTLWFLQNLKTGKRFRLLPLVILAAGLSLLAVLIAGFREDQSVELLGPVGFISTQGISMQVTELAIELKSIFGPHSAAYLWNELVAGLRPGVHFAPGQLFANDLSMTLNPTAYEMGFATGSAYLAEAYLVGGALLVGIASFAIGFTLRCLHNRGTTLRGVVVLAAALPAIIYMPRCGLIEPLATTLKNLGSLAALFPLLWLVRNMTRKFCWRHH